MHIPEWFARALESEHNGNLRLRWSPTTSQFHVEQKVGRQKAPRKRTSPHDDAAIRYKDGYAFVLAVTPGDRTKCPKCGRTTHVPILQMKTARCEFCNAEFRACFYPLGHALLEHLRYIDPHRGAEERLLRDVDRAEEQRLKLLKRTAANHREAATKDEFNRLFEIQSVGYTGKEWTPHA